MFFTHYKWIYGYLFTFYSSSIFEKSWQNWCIHWPSWWCSCCCGWVIIIEGRFLHLHPFVLPLPGAFFLTYLASPPCVCLSLSLFSLSLSSFQGLCPVSSFSILFPWKKGKTSTVTALTSLCSLYLLMSFICLTSKNPPLAHVSFSFFFLFSLSLPIFSFHLHL